MDDRFHYPPDVFSLLVDTIPLLCKGKDDVLLFLRGAGVPNEDLAEMTAKIRADRNSVSKFATLPVVPWTAFNKNAATTCSDTNTTMPIPLIRCSSQAIIGCPPR